MGDRSLLDDDLGLRAFRLYTQLVIMLKNLHSHTLEVSIIPAGSVRQY